MTIKINKRKLLVVEGRDEENFFNAALTKHLAIDDIQVLGIGGKTRLTANLKALKKDANFADVRCIAVVRDADTSSAGATVAAAKTAFDSICGSLMNGEVQLPNPTAHARFVEGAPRVGVFIVPNGTDDGTLETLCLKSVAALPEYGCVTDYFVCLQAHGMAQNNPHKAWAHAWLASRPEPDKRVGEAALASYWPFADAAFDELWSFVRAI